MDLPEVKPAAIEIAVTAETHYSTIGKWEDVPEEEQNQLADK